MMCLEACSAFARQTDGGGCFFIFFFFNSRHVCRMGFQCGKDKKKKGLYTVRVRSRVQSEIRHLVLKLELQRLVAGGRGKVIKFFFSLFYRSGPAGLFFFFFTTASVSLKYSQRTSSIGTGYNRNPGRSTISNV